MVQNDVAEAVYVQRVSRLHVGQHALVRVKPVERRVHIADVVDACDSGLWVDSWHWVAIERRREHVQPLLAACTVGDSETGLVSERASKRAGHHSGDWTACRVGRPGDDQAVWGVAY